MIEYKVVLSEKLSEPYDPRYVVVDENGKILDDAQGYGYKSIRNAHAAWSYKRKPPKQKAKEQAQKRKIQSKIKKFCKEHQDLVRVAEDEMFYITKGACGENDKFDEKYLKTLFEEFNIDIKSLDFTLKDFLKYW